jgi:hypothetical protein
MSQVKFNGYNYKYNIFKPLLGLTRLDHQRQSDMGERLEVNVQLKRLKDAPKKIKNKTGDIVWKAWRNTAFHAGISQPTKGMTGLRA